MLAEPRIIEAKKEDSEVWEQVHMEQLEPGDMFRMFEPDDKAPVVDDDGFTEFMVLEYPAVECDGDFK